MSSENNIILKGFFTDKKIYIYFTLKKNILSNDKKYIIH